MARLNRDENEIATEVFISVSYSKSQTKGCHGMSEDRWCESDSRLGSLTRALFLTGAHNVAQHYEHGEP